jgi:hypothetical protein
MASQYSGVVLKLVLKNYPCTRIFAMEADNCKVEDSDKEEIFISPSSCRNLEIAIFCSSIA